MIPEDEHNFIDEPNWVFYERKEYDKYDLPNAFNLIVNSFNSLKKYWDEYSEIEYSNTIFDRNYFMDFAEVARLIINLKSNKQTEHFDDFFFSIEKVLCYCNFDTEEVIVTGLLESIQNSALAVNMDIKNDFDEWLRPSTKKYWQDLINFWDKE